MLLSILHGVALVITYWISELRRYASCALYTRIHTYSYTLAKMPPPKTTQSSQAEGQIALAIDAFKQGHFTSGRGAAMAYDVHESTLRYRLHGHPTRRDLQPANYKLTAIEESTFVKWILSIDQRSLSPRANNVQQMANLLIQKQLDRASQEIIVGKYWLLNFI